MIGWGHGGIRAGFGALLAGALIAGVPGITPAGAADATSTSGSTSGSTSTSTSAPAPAADSHAANSVLAIGPKTLSFGVRRAGTVSFTAKTNIKNVSGGTVTIDNIKLGKGNGPDFVVGTNCFPGGAKPRFLEPGESCQVQAKFVPRTAGVREVKVHIVDDAPSSPQIITLTGIGTLGYYIAGSEGGVASFGDAVFRGQRRRFSLAAPVIAMNTTRGGSGYWLLGRDGGIFTFGNARFFGSTGGMRLNQPVVGMASVPNGSGYWLVASDGGIFSFGNAKFLGSMGGTQLAQPIVGMARTRSGKGYYLVAADGGIFTFGDAKFYGSSAGHEPFQPAVAMAPTPTGKGYWILYRNGAVYTFGDAIAMRPITGQGRGAFVGIAPTPNSLGYWLSNSVGQVFQTGDAPYYGDVYRRGVTNAAGVVGTAPPLPPLRFTQSVGVIKSSTASQLESRLAAEANARVKF